MHRWRYRGVWFAIAVAAVISLVGGSPAAAGSDRGRGEEPGILVEPNPAAGNASAAMLERCNGI